VVKPRIPDTRLLEHEPTLANVDNPEMLTVGILPRSAPGTAGPNTLLIFTGIALVDVGLNGDDEARSFDVILDLGVKFDNNPLTFVQKCSRRRPCQPGVQSQRGGRTRYLCGQLHGDRSR
jgi:hypothetical protein